MEEIFKPVMVFIIMGLSVEAVVETIKQIRKGKDIDINVVLSIIAGLLLAFTFQLDIYKVLGIEAVVPYVATAITGILISRGGNFVYDLWDKFTGGMNNKE